MPGVGSTSAANKPTIALQPAPPSGCVVARVDTSPEQTLKSCKLSCDPKGIWEAWKEEVLHLQHDWRVSGRELLLQAHIRTINGIQNATILVDTGAKILLVFRRSLLPPNLLKVASFPVQFSMADGKPMQGGTHGLFMELRFPIRRQSQMIMARTVSLFAYEADYMMWTYSWVTLF